MKMQPVLVDGILFFKKKKIFGGGGEHCTKWSGLAWYYTDFCNLSSWNLAPTMALGLCRAGHIPLGTVSSMLANSAVPLEKRVLHRPLLAKETGLTRNGPLSSRAPQQPHVLLLWYICYTIYKKTVYAKIQPQISTSLSHQPWMGSAQCHNVLVWVEVGYREDLSQIHELALLWGPGLPAAGGRSTS